MNLKKDNIPIYILIGILGIISIFIIKSFILPIFFTLVLVYITNPIYKKLMKVFRYHFFTAMLMIIFFIAVFIIPLTYCMINISNDINSLDNGKINLFFDSINYNLGTHMDFNGIYLYNLEKIKLVTNNLFLNSFEFIFEIFLIIFFYYYFSKYYNAEVNYLKRITVNEKYIHIGKKLEKLIDGIIYGQVLVRFIQAALATLGFLIIGIDGAIFLGIITFFAAFLPLIGTGLVWLPLVLASIMIGDYVLSMQILFIGIVVSTIDNFLMPYVISEKTNIGPVATLISIIGGIQFLGIYGVIMGPFILGFLFVLIEEIFLDIRVENPEYRRFIWTEKERKDYRSIRTEKEREEFIKKLEEKYSVGENAIGN